MLRCFVGCLMLLVACAHAQQLDSKNSVSAAPQATPAAALSACAANGANAQNRNLLAEGTISFADPRVQPVRIAIKSRGLVDIRVDIQDADGPSSLVVSHGFAVAKRAGKRLEMAPVFSYFRPEHIPFAACVLDLTRGGMEFADLGIEEVRSRPTQHVRILASPKGRNCRVDNIEQLISEFDVFIDTETAQVLKVRTLIFDPQTVTNYSIWEIYYSDFRAVDGVLLPYKLEAYLSGNPFQTTTFETITAGVSYTDSDFQLQ